MVGSSSPTLTLGPSQPTLGNLSPSLRLRYAALFLDGYTETGSVANLTIGSRTVQIGEIRGQLAFQPTPQTDFGTVQARLRAGVDGIFNWGDNVDAAMIGQTTSFAPGGDNAVARGFVGGDVVMASHGGNVDFNAGFELGYGSDNAFTGEARIGLSGRF